jgi:hypothetical protein
MGSILVAKSKSGERDHKQGHFSLLSGECQPAFVLEKNRTSLPKSTSPPVSASLMREKMKLLLREDFAASSRRRDFSNKKAVY